MAKVDLEVLRRVSRNVGEVGNGSMILESEYITLAADEIAALRAELDAYKADIEAGRLVRYPCRPGDTVWTIWRDTPELTVHSEHVAAILDTGPGPIPCKDYDFDGIGTISGCFDSPRPYYLTQDEAEAARAALSKDARMDGQKVEVNHD